MTQTVGTAPLTSRSHTRHLASGPQHHAPVEANAVHVATYQPLQQPQTPTAAGVPTRALCVRLGLPSRRLPRFPTGLLTLPHSSPKALWSQSRAFLVAGPRPAGLPLSGSLNQGCPGPTPTHSLPCHEVRNASWVPAPTPGHRAPLSRVLSYDSHSAPCNFVYRQTPNICPIEFAPKTKHCLEFLLSHSQASAWARGDVGPGSRASLGLVREQVLTQKLCDGPEPGRPGVAQATGSGPHSEQWGTVQNFEALTFHERQNKVVPAEAPTFRVCIPALSTWVT